MNITAVAALQDNYIWVLQDPTTKQAVCVDPGDAQPVLAYLQDQALTLSAILITHHHWDHTNGIQALLDHTPVPVYGPAQETIVGMTTPLAEGDSIRPEGLTLTLQILDIPAHTAGHIAYYNDELLFCGDTLFLSGCGRLFEGSASQMYHSLQKLAQLSDNTLVYCGHEYTEQNLNFALTVEPNNADIQERLQHIQALRQQNQRTVPSPLSIERLCNPFLRCTEASVITAAEHYASKPLPTPEEVFAVIRQWKDGF